MKKLSLFGWMTILCLLSGCASFPAARAAESQGFPTPTNNVFFNGIGAQSTVSGAGQPAWGTPTLARYFMSRDTATPPSPISLPTANGAVTAITPSQVFTATVYDDQPNPNWSLQATSGMEFDQANTTHAHSGHTSVAMTPHEDFSKLSFIVNQTADTVYPRDRVVAVSFWLNSGNEPLSLTDLGVSMMGSNAHPYWVANDTSVVDETKINFQETRLYDLGINRSIPPETWVQVFVYPNKLIYDPLYKYVTGFYIKNDAGFLRTVYIDDVNLLMISDNTQPTNTVIPSEIASPTPTVTPGPDLLTPTATPEPTATRDFSPTFTVRPTIRPSATSTPKR